MYTVIIENFSTVLNDLNDYQVRLFCIKLIKSNNLLRYTQRDQNQQPSESKLFAYELQDNDGGRVISMIRNN